MQEKLFQSAPNSNCPHPQPPTPLNSDNSTALRFIKSNIRQKKSKSWDMRFNWLRDRKLQQQFHFYWDKGIHNDADYNLKYHAQASFSTTTKICHVK